MSVGVTGGGAGRRGNNEGPRSHGENAEATFGAGTWIGKVPKVGSPDVMELNRRDHKDSSPPARPQSRARCNLSGLGSSNSALHRWHTYR
jgi:hypothetical protein